VSLVPVPGKPGRGCAAAPTAAGHTLTLTLAGAGRSFCARMGARVFVVLQGSPDRKWTPIRLVPAGSSVLVPRADGRLALMAGATGAAYAAVHPGTVRIVSYRKVCAGAATGPSPGAVGSIPATASPAPAAGCDVMIEFHATVTVRR
jgi:hypothetical protein